MYLTFKLRSGKTYVIQDALLASINIPAESASSATLRIWTSEDERPHLFDERQIRFEIINTLDDADAAADLDAGDVKAVVEWHPIGSVPPEFFAGTDEHADLLEITHESDLGLELEYDAVDYCLAEIKTDSTCENAVKLFAAITDSGRTMIGFPVFEGIVLMERMDADFNPNLEEIDFNLELPISADISLMDRSCRCADSEGLEKCDLELKKACSEGRVFFEWLEYGVGRFHILERCVPDAIFVEKAKVTKHEDQSA